jgi:hypothetical protein
VATVDELRARLDELSREGHGDLAVVYLLPERLDALYESRGRLEVAKAGVAPADFGQLVGLTP